MHTYSHTYTHKNKYNKLPPSMKTPWKGFSLFTTESPVCRVHLVHYINSTDVCRQSESVFAVPTSPVHWSVCVSFLGFPYYVPLSCGLNNRNVLSRGLEATSRRLRSYQVHVSSGNSNGEHFFLEPWGWEGADIFFWDFHCLLSPW